VSITLNSKPLEIGVCCHHRTVVCHLRLVTPVHRTFHQGSRLPQIDVIKIFIGAFGGDTVFPGNSLKFATRSSINTTTLKMYSAPANNPMTTTSADPNECIWGDESQQNQEPAATAPPATTNPPQAPREHSKEREQLEQRPQLSWRTTPPTRSLFSSQEPPPIVYSSSKPRLMEQPPTFGRRHTTRDSSPDEENVRRLFETIGHLSITDTAFALQPFTGV
jgi:hypothetical protein